jgi:hypothetical protein
VTKGLLCVRGVMCFKFKEILILYTITLYKYLLQKEICIYNMIWYYNLLFIYLL